MDGKTKKRRKVLWREFTKSYDRRIEKASVYDDYRRETQSICQEEYNRFVKLANSGCFVVEILDADHGVGWVLHSPKAAQ